VVCVAGGQAAAADRQVNKDRQQVVLSGGKLQKDIKAAVTRVFGAGGQGRLLLADGVDAAWKQNIGSMLCSCAAAAAACQLGSGL
jgi:hypothetical protein